VVRAVSITSGAATQARDHKQQQIRIAIMKSYVHESRFVKPRRTPTKDENCAAGIYATSEMVDPASPCDIDLVPTATESFSPKTNTTLDTIQMEKFLQDLEQNSPLCRKWEGMRQMAENNNAALGRMYANPTRQQDREKNKATSPSTVDTGSTTEEAPPPLPKEPSSSVKSAIGMWETRSAVKKDISAVRTIQKKTERSHYLAASGFEDHTDKADDGIFELNNEWETTLQERALNYSSALDEDDIVELVEASGDEEMKREEIESVPNTDWKRVGLWLVFVLCCLKIAAALRGSSVAPVACTAIVRTINVERQLDALLALGLQNDDYGTSSL